MRPERTAAMAMVVACGLLLHGCRTIEPPATPPPRTPAPSPPAINWPNRIPTAEINWPDDAVPGFGVRSPQGHRMKLERVGLKSNRAIYAFSPVEESNEPWIAFEGVNANLIDSSRSYLVASIAPGRPVSDEQDFDPPEHFATDVHVLYPKTHRYRGTAVVLASLARLTPQEQEVLEQLLDHGWVVLCSCPTIPQSTIEGGQAIEPDRFPGGSGRRFATLVDDRLGEWANSIQAVVEHVSRNGRQLPEPAVLLGVSMGAIGAAPTAARLHEHLPIRAAVLVAGGFNLGRLLGETSLADHDLRIRRIGQRPSNAARLDFEAAYESTARLDTRPLLHWLGQRPVLIIEGSSDTAVSGRSREALHTALGRPERWRYPVGHVGLFLVLPGAAGEICRWLDRWSPIPDRQSAFEGQPPQPNHKSSEQDG